MSHDSGTGRVLQRYKTILPVCRRGGRMVAFSLLLVAIAGCQSWKDATSDLFAVGNSVEAPMVSIGGSAATGMVRFTSTASGVAMQVQMSGLRVGAYRIVIHANGNCTSPNGFSAGAPWIPTVAPPGATAQLRTGVAVGDGSFNIVERIAGLRVDGPDSLAGKSVVVHAGTQGSLEAQPGIPNDRVACGVIGTGRSLF